MILSQQVAAPFSGIAVLTDTDNEIMIINSGELPPGSEMIITNIVPIEEIQHPEDKLYVEKKVRPKLDSTELINHQIVFRYSSFLIRKCPITYISQSHDLVLLYRNHSIIKMDHENMPI